MEILNNANCDLGTALMIFYLADGYGYFYLDEQQSSSKYWIEFIKYIYIKITKDEFIHKQIRHIPDFTRVQLYKIRKHIPNLPEVFLKGTDGVDIDIPVI